MAKAPSVTRSKSSAGTQSSVVQLSNEKVSFEKIKSPTEARALYGTLAQEGKEFYCKGEGPLFAFKPVSFEASQGLTGKLRLFDEEKVSPENVIVNFGVGKDRYYTIADFRPLGEGRGLLILNEMLYRLERREFYRVVMPEKMTRDCNIISYDGRSSFIAAVIVDLSVGGARLQVLKDKLKDLKPGGTVTCVMHVKDKWSFELKAIVRHIIAGQKTDVLGVQFTAVEESVNRKLISLMMELQREVIRERAQV